ncbi:hypothetical protein PENTCL1PPCAC_2335 [Pristionchus entomophagus]|uniref:BED-type domain-containing protein n=1 Tax=Pristionchus entomophagus TaxID=358040 RepID=A0AAV5SJ22_9BILA|nr:hypothetical protein PENTCL1PPCAC_2335 [Pristionchus entomophagus]
MTEIESGGAILAALSTPSIQEACMGLGRSPPMVPPHIPPTNNVPNPRNAGRKKSNPVWEFFTDLRAYGLAGVRCRFCHWLTNDRSPTTMKFHLKRKHDTGPGGLWAICEEKIGQQAPAQYSRKRSANESNDMLRKTVMQNVMSSVQENLLSSIIQQARNGKQDLSSLLNGHSNNNGNENVMFTAKMEESEDIPLEETLSHNSGPTPFSLSDGIADLVNIANESDLVFTFNSRRNGEFCFESHTPEKKGHLVTFADGVSELLVIHSIDGEEKVRECWKKSDWHQFQWAVRGTITHFLK